MRFTFTATLLMASATLGMAAKDPKGPEPKGPEPRPSACTPSQPDRSVPAYGPIQTLYGQCGGKDYTGRTKCQKPFVCLKQNDYYSQCLEDPTATKPDGSVQTLYGQCGGKGYAGPTKCAEPWTCKKQENNDYYSQCL
ncbi:hypothetical protein MBLNU13_g08426t2 [Cladosporium sp. NU13]